MTVYKFVNYRNPKHIVECELFAKYEIDITSIDFNYPPEVEDVDIFKEWERRARASNPEGFVYIDWFVVPDNRQFKPEWIPLEDRPCDAGDILDYYTHPYNIETGELVDWSELPVAGSFINSHFIERLTGWSPSILQTRVDIDWLVEQVNKSK